MNLGSKTLADILSRIAPNNIQNEHDNTWHDGNGHSHVRASLSSPSITIPSKKKWPSGFRVMATNSIFRDGQKTKRMQNHA